MKKVILGGTYYEKKRVQSVSLTRREEMRLKTTNLEILSEL